MWTVNIIYRIDTFGRHIFVYENWAIGLYNITEYIVYVYIFWHYLCTKTTNGIWFYSIA